MYWNIQLLLYIRLYHVFYIIYYIGYYLLYIKPYEKESYGGSFKTQRATHTRRTNTCLKTLWRRGWRKPEAPVCLCSFHIHEIIPKCMPNASKMRSWCTLGTIGGSRGRLVGQGVENDLAQQFFLGSQCLPWGHHSACG